MSVKTSTTPKRGSKRNPRRRSHRPAEGATPTQEALNYKKAKRHQPRIGNDKQSSSPKQGRPGDQSGETMSLEVCTAVNPRLGDRRSSVAQTSLKYPYPFGPLDGAVLNLNVKGQLLGARMGIYLIRLLYINDRSGAIIWGYTRSPSKVQTFVIRLNTGTLSGTLTAGTPELIG